METYSTKESVHITGLTNSQFEKAVARGVITKIGRGKYSKADVDAYTKELNERRQIPSAQWSQDQKRRLYRAGDIPGILGVSKFTVNELRKSGSIKAVSYGWYDADSVDAFSQEKKHRESIRAEWHLVGNSE